MLRLFRGVWILLLGVAALWAAKPRLPFPQHLHYGSGTILPSLKRETMDEDVRRFYDYWKREYLVREGEDDAGRPLYRVAMGHPGKRLHGTTTSESQGYGMLIAAWMAGADPKAQEIFDGLWRFSRQHPSTIDPDLMSWRYRTEDPDHREDSAFDGDADIAYALLLADRQWGSGGSVDYRSAARTVMRAIERSTIGPQSRLPMLGDWVDPDGKRYNQYTNRSSDLMPLWFETFVQAGDAARWRGVAETSLRALERLQRDFAPKTGLVPDFFVPRSAEDHRPRPAPADFLEGPHDGAYYYNACRVPMRIGWDALWSGRALSRRIVRKLNRWARETTGGDAKAFRAGYDLDGSPVEGSDYFSSAFVAPLGVAAMNDPRHRAWLDRIYRSVRKRHQDYYEDSLALLSLLTMSGNFWSPFTRIRTLYPRRMRVSRGSASDTPLAALRREDQNGTADNWRRYIEMSPDDQGRFRARFDIVGEPSVRSCARSYLTLNAKGNPRSVDRWNLSVWEAEEGRYRVRWRNGERDWIWQSETVPLGAARRWSDTQGRFRLRLEGRKLEDVLDLDYLALRLEGCPFRSDGETGSYVRPEPGDSFNLQYSETGDLRSRGFDVMDLDMEDTNASVIRALKREGHIVICYFSAGSWEDWRSDAKAFPEALLGKKLDGWPGERWLDIRQIDQLAPLMRRRMERARAKGCDGVDPDNVDGYTNDTGFDLTARDQLRYNRMLAETAHDLNLSVGLKNDNAQIGRLVDAFDFAVNESCYRYGECGVYRRFTEAGKAVFIISYRKAGFERRCDDARKADYFLILKHRALDRFVRRCR